MSPKEIATTVVVVATLATATYGIGRFLKDTAEMLGEAIDNRAERIAQKKTPVYNITTLD